MASSTFKKSSEGSDPTYPNASPPSTEGAVELPVPRGIPARFVRRTAHFPDASKAASKSTVGTELTSTSSRAPAVTPASSAAFYHTAVKKEEKKYEPLRASAVPESPLDEFGMRCDYFKDQTKYAAAVVRAKKATPESLDRGLDLAGYVADLKDGYDVFIIIVNQRRMMKLQKQPTPPAPPMNNSSTNGGNPIVLYTPASWTTRFFNALCCINDAAAQPSRTPDYAPLSKNGPPGQGI